MTTSMPAKGTPAISISGGNSFPQPQDLSVTPGGTIYATTPGGTRIVYDRNALLFLRNSPLSKTPPTHIAFIPGVTTVPDGQHKPKKPEESTPKPAPQGQHHDEDEELFKME